VQALLAINEFIPGSFSLDMLAHFGIGAGTVALTITNYLIVDDLIAVASATRMLSATTFELDEDSKV